MKLNDTLQSARWIDGTETQEQRAQYESDVTNSMIALGDSDGWLIGPVTFTEKRPGDDQVPPVPDHIQGERIRLLVGEAEIVGKKPETTPASFIGNLDRKDLMRLRHLTRVAHAKTCPKRLGEHKPLSDSECDAIIEECGPEAAVATLKRTVKVFQ